MERREGQLSDDYTFQTQILHNKHKYDKNTGAVSVPVYHASTFHQPGLDEFGKYDYSRSGNPTREALEETIAELEGGTRGFAYSSGMAAISSAFMLLSKGDHVLVSEDVYGGTFRLITEVLTRFGINHTFVDMTNLDNILDSLRNNTKVIYMETPSNPLLKVTDIKAVVSIAKMNNCMTFLDNTFLTPALQRPLDLGVDVVLHSATKFLSGHSDVVSGLAVVKDEELGERLGFLQNSLGSILGVQDAWLVLRGLKTLYVRLKQSSDTAQKIAEFLYNHPKVENVFYPGLYQHQGYEIQKQQAKGPGAVLSFQLKNEDAVRAFVQHVQIPVFAVSLGAVETILSYPSKMSHAAIPQEERYNRGITDGLLRLSIGLENPDELIRDFANALSLVPNTVKEQVY
jgi:cystathionine beta-lyase